MPDAPRTFQPPGYRTAKQRKALHDRERLSAAKRGYDASWRKLRLVVLGREPLCRTCAAAGRVEPATEVDHIMPFSVGGVINEALRLDTANLQPLCKSCHAAKTATEDGSGWKRKSAAAKPEWIGRASIPVVLVCGASASGKSTYVNAHRGAGDLVIDLDEIAVGLFGDGGWRRRNWSREVLNKALERRNDLLVALAGPHAPWPRAWLIAAEPTPQGREWWRDRLGIERAVVVMTAQIECLRRIESDPDRRAARAEQERIVSQWFERYQPHPLDHIVKGEGG